MKEITVRLLLAAAVLIQYPYIGGYEKKGNRQNTFSCGKRMGEIKRS